MASRLLNRRELRKQADDAEAQQAADPSVAVPATKPAKATRAAKAPKAPKSPTVRKPRKKKEPIRMCARWGVFDNSMKQVAIFDYSQRAAADEKLADLRSKKKGLFFLQIVKEPMTVPDPIEAPAAL